jgi:hypothetical protein
MMAGELNVDTFVMAIAALLTPGGITTELMTDREDGPHLMRCHHPAAGRSVFLLADPADCSLARAELLADYVKREIPI